MLFKYHNEKKVDNLENYVKIMLCHKNHGQLLSFNFKQYYYFTVFFNLVLSKCWL